MHTETYPKKVVASAVISELQSSDIYLSLKARLFDLRANLNGVRVTEAFLDEIVENEAKYICQPLYADIRGLIASRTVGHMYNSRTGEFHSTQIGAFYRFEKETDGDNSYLVGYARVPKRNKALCKALSDLFTDNALKFSFELNCSVYEKDDDGTMIIDAAEGNYWEGECVVTFPACETAIAQELIAECLSKGDENMADEKIVNAESEVVEIAEASEVVVSENVNDAAQIVAETETAETVYVTKEHTEIDNVRAYNGDTGEELEQRVVVETTTRTPVQLAEEEAPKDEEKTDDEDDSDDEEVIAEAEVIAETESDNEDEEKPENKEIAETTPASTAPDWAKLIAELCETVNTLRKEVAELKVIPENAAAVIAEEILSEEQQPEKVVAESVTGDISDEPLMNPFMASISAPKKYSLLDKEEKHAHKYSLLDRA